MDATDFDSLTRAVATLLPRRTFAGALGLGALARPGLIEAKKKKRKKKKKCAKAGQRPKKKHKKRCCKGLSKDATGRCARPCDVCASGCAFTSVQAAIDAAAPGATLTLCAGTFTETIEIEKNLTLVGAGDGAGPENTILDGAGAGAVVFIAAGSTVTLRNLRLTGGYGGDAGGIFNNGTVALTGCAVIGNTATNVCGGIRNDGTLELINSSVSGNTAGSVAGGICNISGMVELIDSSVTANAAGDSAGGIYNDGTIELINSSVTGNKADISAGGIRNNGGAVICSGSSTVSDNTRGNPPVPSNCIDDAGGTGCATCPD